VYRSGRSPHWLKIKNPNAPAVKREARRIGAANKKEAPLLGLKRQPLHVAKLLSANAGGACIVARFFAVLLVHFFLSLAGLT
jgi:hypothetical protein